MGAAGIPELGGTARPAVGAGGWIVAHASFASAAALLLATVTITGLIETPAMIDYLNHLARMEMLASGKPHPAYEIHWDLIPNLAMDLLVPPLAQLVGAAAATKAFLIMSQVLVVSGAIALERVVKGRLGLAGLAAMPVLFSTPFGWGLLNFTFALGVAVWGVASWIALRERGWIRWAAHWVFVMALFVGHFFALGLYGLVIGAYELSRSERLEPRRLVRLAAPMAAPLGVLLAVMWLSGNAVGSDGLDWDFPGKGWWLLRLLNTSEPLLAAATAAVLGALILAMTLAGFLRVTRPGVWIAVVLLALYLIIPNRLFRSAYVDMRVISAAMLILPAFCHLSGRRHLVAATLAGITLVNGASTFLVWRDRQADYAELRATFPLIEPGSTVLIARQDAFALRDQPLYYAPTLAAPRSGAFVSSFYAARGMQPVAARPRYRSLEVAKSLDYVPPTESELRSPLAPHLLGWTQRYRYLFVIGQPRPSTLPALSKIAAGRRFVLYRISDR